MAKENMKTMHDESVKYQYIAAFVVNLLLCGYGVMAGWSSPASVILMSDRSPLPSGKITMEESSWIASLASVGGVIGNVLCGFITGIFGRKVPLLVITIPTIMGWILVLFAENVYYLYASRLLIGGAVGGMFVLVPLYLSEIANVRIRGILGSTLLLMSNIGTLLAYIFGAYCDYFTAPKFVIVLTLLFILLFMFFPETPSFLIRNNKIEDAEKSVQFYQNLRGKDNDYKLLGLEMDKLQKTVAMNEKSMDNWLTWSDFTSKPARKAIAMSLLLSALNQFSGCFAMMNYTTQIFQDAGSSMSADMSSIVVAVIQIFGSYVSTLLVERTGRKFLFVASTIGTAMGLSTLGVYKMFQSWNYDMQAVNWVPMASFSFTIFIASFAVLNLSVLVISEILPEKLKESVLSFCLTLMWVFAFFIVKYLPLMNEVLGFHGSMFCFAGFCLFSALYLIVFMPETKGKTHEEIMQTFR